MLLSKLFTKTRKEVAKDEISLNAKLLVRAGFVSKEMAGVYNFLPLGLIMLKKIQEIIRKEINVIGGQEILMPTLTPIESYKKTKRDKIDVLFKTKLHSGAEFVLNQSHEEVITPLVAQFVRSYKDLPSYVYQIQTKFRNEPRAKSGLLRGREFSMKDLYSFHVDQKDLDGYYEIVKKAYFKIFDRLGIGDRTYLVYASGGTFSKYSHEFQTLCATGEDEIYLCPRCKIGVNKEIINEPFDSAQGRQKVCPECKGKKFEIKKTIEVGNIFKLGSKFSDAFEFKFVDRDGKLKPIIMGCYGMGPSRIMGTIAEIFNDENGLVLPEAVAPYKYHVVVLNLKSQISNLKNIVNILGEENCLIDDRDISAGGKFADADLLGMPYRVVISPKTLEKKEVEIKDRKSGEIEMVKIDKITKL